MPSIPSRMWYSVREMPYIAQETRELIAEGKRATTPGELNYVITEEIKRYFDTTVIDRPISYSDINEVMGVLECCKLELYRRVATPYEDEKIQVNGDVY